MVFIKLKYGFCTFSLLRVFIINGYWLLSNAFIEMSTCFLSFILLICFITLIDLWILNSPYVSGINSTLSSCVIILIIDEFVLVIFWQRPMHLYSPKRSDCNFLYVLFWFCHRGNADLIKWVWKCSFLYIILKNFGSIYVNFSLKFGGICQWSHPVLYFSVSGVFVIICLISLLVIGLFIFWISSWLIFGMLYVSRHLSISFRVFNLLVYSCS